MSPIRVPEDAGYYATGIKRILERFPERGGIPAQLECHRGWYPIIVELDEKLNALNPDYQVFQVKEKFGGLRYYTSWPTNPQDRDIWEQPIRDAEARSFQVCEECGAPGEIRYGNWVQTLCEHHHENRPSRWPIAPIGE